MANERTFVRVRRVIAGFLVLATIGGCKLLEKLGPHEGDSCTGEVATCQGHDAALACHDKKYIETKCRGPQGCSRENDKILCDFSDNTADDTCPPEWNDEAKCRGPAGYVECHDGHYRPFECRGPDGCVTKNEKVSCDMTVVVEGDACSEEDAASCSKDKSTFFSCKKGKMGAPLPCRGPLGCHKKEGTTKIACDKSVSQENDPCDEAGAACTPDGAKMLSCHDGKMMLKHICRGGPCKIEDGNVSCANWGIGEVGDPCTETSPACSTDGKSFLHCKDGKFAVTRACHCVTDGTTVQCK